MRLLFQNDTVEDTSTCERSMSHGLEDVYATGYRSCTLKNANALDKVSVTSADAPHHQLQASSSVSSSVQVDSIPSISGLEVAFLDDLGVAPLTQDDVDSTNNPTAAFDGQTSFLFCVKSAASNLKDVNALKFVSPRFGILSQQDSEVSVRAAKDVNCTNNPTAAFDGHPSFLSCVKSSASNLKVVNAIKLVSPRFDILSQYSDVSVPAARVVDFTDNDTFVLDVHPSFIFSEKNGDSNLKDVNATKLVSPRFGILNQDSEVSVPAARDIDSTDNDTLAFDVHLSSLFSERSGDSNLKDVNGNVIKLEPESRTMRDDDIDYSDEDSYIEILDLSTSLNISAESVPSDTEDKAARLMPLDIVRGSKRATCKEVPQGATAHSKTVDSDASATLDMTTERQSDVSTSPHFGLSGVLSSTPTKNPFAHALQTKGAGVSSENTTLLGQTTFNEHIPMSSTPSRRHAGSTFHLSSPAKKRTSAGFQFKSPTNRTPKRKVAAASLVWDVPTTNTFVQECVARKGDVQKDEIPIRTWKEISAAMKEKGETYSWEMCRAKYHQMNNYFANKMIGVGGSLGGIKWPHYEQFCEIHDVPRDFVPSDDAARDVILTPSKKGQIWVPDSERLLISLYSDLKSKFDGTHSTIRHNTLYNQIAATMQSFTVMVSGKQCKSHMNSLIGEFRKAYDEAGRTGAAAPTFLHYDRLLEIFKGSATLVTPVAVSVGQGLTYTVAGVIEGDSKRGFRSRPKTTSNSEDKPKKVSKKTLFKSWAQEIQERQLELKEKHHEEFRLMREGFEKRSDERSATLKELVQIVKEKRNNK